jgi:hypothetical protein
VNQRLLTQAMTHRKIKDGKGKAWDVWEVYPSAVEQRMSGEHPAVSDSGATPEKREVRIRVPSALQEGWLAFQSGNDRRRLAPIPHSWIRLDDAELIRLLARADRLTESDGG